MLIRSTTNIIYNCNPTLRFQFDTNFVELTPKLTKILHILRCLVVKFGYHGNRVIKKNAQCAKKKKCLSFLAYSRHV